MKMIPRLLAAMLCLLAGFAALPLRAQPAPVAAPKADAAPAPTRPALWKVADEDTTIWLFGTVHALPEGIAWYDGAVRTAFEGSRELVTEIAKPDPARMQELVLSKAVLPEGQSLRSLMSADQRARFDAALAQLGIAAAAFDRFEPWYAAIAISTMPLAQDGFATQHGVEDALDSRAKALGMTHGALETPEYQLSLFDSLPADAQQRYLDQVIAQLPKIRDQLRIMVEAWKTGDADTLAALINDENDDPVLFQRLLVDRNVLWAKWIGERMARPGTVFVAVGAGHLAGKGSVQEQLVAAGLAVKRQQ